MDLDSGAIYSIQQWLEYENTPSMRAAIHRDVRMNERFDVTRAIFETVTVDREVIHISKKGTWIIEFAARQDNGLPVMFGRPMSVSEYHEKRDRRN